MKKSDLTAFIKEEILNEMAINEMAKIAGDLKTSIEKVIKNNPDLETLLLKKAIKADADVQAALGDQSLYDNQLGKFITAAKGEREVGQRGRKADPNKETKPKSTTGKKGRPAKSKEEKEKESKRVSSKLSRSVTTVKGDEPSAKDIKQAIGGTGINRKAKKDLKAQEKRKMVKAFIKDMQDKGILSLNNKIEDKEKYDAAWTVEKEKIQTALKQVREASAEEVNNQKELNKELEKTSNLKKQAGLTEENIGLADLEEMGYEAGVEAYIMANQSMNFRNSPDFKAYKQGFFQGFTDESSAQGLNEIKKK